MFYMSTIRAFPSVTPKRRRLWVVAGLNDQSQSASCLSESILIRLQVTELLQKCNSVIAVTRKRSDGEATCRKHAMSGCHIIAEQKQTMCAKV